MRTKRDDFRAGWAVFTRCVFLGVLAGVVSHGGFADENTIDEAGIQHQLISGDDMEAANTSHKT